MNLIKSTMTAIATAMAFAISLAPAMAKDEAKKIGDSVKALKVISAHQKSGIPPEAFKDVLAVAIFPGAKKIDFMVKGAHGKGFLLEREGEGKWGSPLFLTLSGGTMGWQPVGDPMDIYLLFRNRKNVDDVMKGKLYMGVKPALVMDGPLGKTMKGATGDQKKADIISYVFSRGEFELEASIATATLQIDSAANDAFYGKPKVSVEEILSGKAGKPSEDLKALHKLLTDYANRK
jgi:lipid-binding SYLF domain-containing protein